MKCGHKIELVNYASAHSYEVCLSVCVCVCCAPFIVVSFHIEIGCNDFANASVKFTENAYSKCNEKLQATRNVFCLHAFGFGSWYVQSERIRAKKTE